MAKGMIDVSIFGDAELERQLHALELGVQKKVVRPALRASAMRIRGYMMQYIPVDTGAYRTAMGKAKIRAGKSRPGLIRLGLVWPTRAELGIGESHDDDRHFWPAALEYGHVIRGKGQGLERLVRLKKGPDAGLLVRRRDMSDEAKASRWQGKRVEARPHMRPAVDNNIRKELALMAVDMRRRITAILNKRKLTIAGIAA